MNGLKPSEIAFCTQILKGTSRLPKNDYTQRARVTAQFTIDCQQDGDYELAQFAYSQMLVNCFAALVEAGELEIDDLKRELENAKSKNSTPAHDRKKKK
jgi:hypothetical protein